MKRNIEHYINRTKANNIPIVYDLYVDDMQAIIQMIKEDNIFDAIRLAFLYGRAKGIRYARKEARRV